MSDGSLSCKIRSPESLNPCDETILLHSSIGLNDLNSEWSVSQLTFNPRLKTECTSETKVPISLEPQSRQKSTYVLQEYFVPVDKFDAFADLMAEIFTRYKVNVINVSIRHAKADSGSLLAWAREEIFAFVVWYKQGTTEIDKNKVAVWTRELINAVNSLNGSYYLPYQAHATAEQFHLAYPQAEKLIELKKKFDSDFKFRNVIWDIYYKINQNEIRV